MLDWFSTPYSLRETLGMIRRRFALPPPRRERATRRRQLIDPDSSVDRWLGFVGDISPLQGRTVRYAPAIERFFADCSCMVGNLEGVITDQPWFPYLHNHRLDVFDALSALKPLDHWVVSVANNHAMDYGPRALMRTFRECQRRGVRCMGTTEVPRIALEDDITVTGWTWWLNRNGSGVARRDPGKLPARGLHIAYPHWGYEHERRPRPDQRQKIPTDYAAVIGHHSHLPQPLELVDEHRPVAWSLGNFITAKQLPVLGEGAVVRFGVSLSTDSPRIVEVIYQKITIERPLGENFCRIVPMEEESR